MDDLFLFDSDDQQPIAKAPAAEDNSQFYTAPATSEPLPAAWDESMLAGLNPEQKEAVCHHEGPLLILAGAGSGKTRVITFRIAYLLRVRKVRPSSILAITFTNKAANEMKERIRDLVGDTASYMWVGTFHSMFSRILRRHAELLGFTRSFSILDTDDQLKAIKECISEMNLNDKIFIPRSIAGEISRAKNEMTTPEMMERDAGADFRLSKTAAIYRRYKEKMRAANAMDFDDILYYAVELFEKNADVLTYYQEQFRYIMVDEYQDTNHAQYRLILQLAKLYHNLCVVGDDDQSIYSFRGANIRNILDFEKDFRNTKVIKLEQNYRSTDNILQAANSLIRRNSSRKSKTLRTELGAGEKITWYSADHHGAEAYYVTDQINRLIATKKFAYKDIAVLYRMNALSRTIETALREQGIPYRVYGGQRFYDRKEIKDILAYLRLIMSPDDNYAFDRVINVPKRGIGDTTVEKLREIALRENCGLLTVCASAAVYPELQRSAPRLMQFYDLIVSFREKIDENKMNFAEFIEFVQDQSGMMQEIIEQKEKKGETVDRVENLKELLSEAVEFETRRRSLRPVDEENDDIASDAIDTDNFESLDATFSTDLRGILEAYLENAALYSEGDNDDTNDDFVRLLTIHSAKGLEFGVVFLVGAEEGLFPSARSIESNEAIEEERRLAYVAITRAKKKLHIISSRSRIVFGQTQQMPPSRFILEVDQTYIEPIGTMRKSFVDSNDELSRYRTAPGAAGGRTTTGVSGYPARGGATVGSGFSSGSSGSTVGGMAAFGRVPGYSGTTVASGTGSSAGGDSADYLTPETIAKGMDVKHPRFGKGRVITVEKVAGDALVAVAFDNKTTKNMLVRQAKLVKA